MMMTPHDAAVTQQLLQLIPAALAGVTASSSEPSHPNATTTDNRTSHQWTAASTGGAHSPTCVPPSDERAKPTQVAVKKRNTKKLRTKKRPETEQHTAAVLADADARTATAKSGSSVSLNASQCLSTRVATARNDDYDETEFDPGIAEFFMYPEDACPPKRSQRPHGLMIISLVPPRLNSEQADGRTDGQIEGADSDSKIAASPSPFPLPSPLAPFRPPSLPSRRPLSTSRNGRGPIEPGEPDETDECSSGDAGHTGAVAIGSGRSWRYLTRRCSFGRPTPCRPPRTSYYGSPGSVLTPLAGPGGPGGSWAPCPPLPLDPVADVIGKWCF